MKRFTIFTILSGIFAFFANAYESEKFIIHPEDSTGQAVITIFYPDAPVGIAAMMCPGGGYSHLATGHEGFDMVPWFMERGIVYAVLEYRFPKGNYEIPISDARDGIRTMRRACADRGLDIKKSGVMGGSAGGHLASSLSTMYRDADERPDFTVLIYPVVDLFDKDIYHGGSCKNLMGDNANDDALRLRFSPNRNVTVDTPEAFLVLSSDDHVKPANALRYAQALIDHKIPVSLHVYPDGGHGWGFHEDFQWHEPIFYELGLWFERLAK